MKIENAWIDDPTLNGSLAPPTMCVESDEMPTVTINPAKFSGGWTVGKFGPFVNYVHEDGPTASDFNIRFRGRFPMVVDITLYTRSEEITGFSLPLSRARQLIRKYDPAWKLIVSERGAESGKLFWIPTQINPACRALSGNCGKQPSRYIKVGSIDMPLCETHLQEHNRAYASRRASRAS